MYRKRLDLERAQETVTFGRNYKNPEGEKEEEPTLSIDEADAGYYTGEKLSQFKMAKHDWDYIDAKAHLHMRTCYVEFEWKPIKQDTNDNAIGHGSSW